jgi:regulator of sigma E protease
VLTIAAFIFVLGVLIFVHELGHFLAAKAVGIGVPRFSIGFGPPTPLRFRRGETEYLVSWFPLGGYVKMASREEQEAMAALEGGELEEVFPPEKLFESKPLWGRILTISAGVIMNVLFAWAVYSSLTLIYGRVEDPTTTVYRVKTEGLPEAAAALAELPSRSRIVRINGEEVGSWGDVWDGITDPRSERLAIELADGGAVTVDIPGADARARVSVAEALVPDWPARVAFVSPGEPADRAGLQRGDLIVAVDGQPIGAWDDLTRAIQPRAGDTLTLSFERDGVTSEVSLVPATVTLEDPMSGESREVGQIGITPLLEEKRIRFGPGAAFVEGGRRTWDNAATVLFALKGIVTGNISPKELGGPILIGQASGQFARAGFVALLVFMAFLSVNLAVLNLLPIPVLDGGHLIFLILEGLRGRPLALEVRQRLTQVGLVIILGIMVLALGNDLMRLTGW